MESAAGARRESRSSRRTGAADQSRTSFWILVLSGTSRSGIFPWISDEQIERLRKKLADTKSYEDLMGKDGAIKELQSSAVNDHLDAELTAHLGYEKLS